MEFFSPARRSVDFKKLAYFYIVLHTNFCVKSVPKMSANVVDWLTVF